jgi:predicted ArsR family transcriptional regulator
VADDFAEQVAGVAALAEPVRRDLYRFVVAQPDPVSRDQACAGVGVPRHTAKFHLDKLVEQGLLDTEFRRLGDRQGPGAGRPTKLYRRSGREVAVTVPERRYDLAGQLLATAVEESAREGTPVLGALHRAAAALGRRLGDQARAAAGRRPARDQMVRAACDVLASHGYEPRAEGDTVTLANCPFHALARKHTELVCGMNLALVSAVARNGADDRLTARLDPADGRCCVVLDVR